MPLATLKVIWPRALAPAPRDWVGKNVSRGRIAGGSFSVQSSARPVPGALRKGDGQPRLALSLDANDLEIRTLPNLPSIEVPAGTIRLEGSALEITIPDASAPLAQGRKLALKSGRFVVGDVMAEPPTAEISFRAQGQAAAVIELIEGEPFKVGRIVESTSDIDGKVDGQLTLSLPLKRKLAADDLRVEGLVKLSDGRARQLLGSYDAQAATILFNVSDKAIDAKGDMLIAGVATKLSWQRIFDAPPEKQPPLRLSATLDNSDRAQLGINVSNNILGEVPVELIITPDADDKRHVHIGADLTRADVVLDNIAWRKPPGRAAFLQFDLVPGGRHKTELQNFKVIGDDIAIEGWMGLDAQNRLRELSFPDFSINLITRMELQGVLRNDNVWEIRGRGQTYDGREFFRSLFSVGELGERPPASRRDQPGLDLKVDIDTVIGFSDVSLRRVVMQLSRRAGKLTQLDARGVLDGNKPLEVTLQQAPKERKLVAVSDDAGQVFRLVDFYPSLQGGRMRLEVNLDGRGPAEKTGTLAVDKFRLLGDPVISEVLQFPDENRAVDAPRTRRVVRQSIDFDWMRVPFSVGYGQFVMGESELRGPLVGATLRGKSDFRARTISLVGTYVPLQGLNSALGAIPGLGQLLAGPKGEGVLGITFAVQGPMSQPQVLVNPLSLVAPGIFREMFQLSDPSRTVTPPPRIDQTRPAPDGRGRSPGASAPQGRTTAGEPGISTGWSSETTPVQSTNK